MAIAKLVLLIIGVVAQQYGATTPNVRPPAEQLREQHGGEHLVSPSIVFAKLVLWSWALLEASVLATLSGYIPPQLARSLYDHLPAALAPLIPSTAFAAHPTALTSPTPLFVAGTLLALSGALLRVHCFRALGDRFTFELAIRPTHALVTRGVYGVVRHPSYVGVFGQAIGGLLCVLDPRGVVVAVLAGALHSVFGPLGGNGSGGGGGDGPSDGFGYATMVTTGVLMLSILAVGLNERMNREDAMLEENFGEAWRTWAREVPWRLVPGVY